MTLQTFQVPALTGLDKVAMPQQLAENPGMATVLDNIEVLPEGGYRKINGYLKWGALPDLYNDLQMRGIIAYQGLVVSVGEYLLHCPDGSSWFVVNKVTGDTAKTPIELNALDMVPRQGIKSVEYAVRIVGDKQVLVITDDENEPAMLTYEAGRYQYEISTDKATAGMRFITHYQDHIVLSGKTTEPGLVAVSARFAPMDFKGAGSWAFQVQDEVTGLHTFRDFLYVFCKGAIYRVMKLEDSSQATVRPVTTKIGCIDGRTIQEIGGDILFLARDGLRYLGATERIDDVNLNVVSYAVQPLLDEIDISKGPLNSLALPTKAQYRLFYTDIKGTPKGLLGTVRSDRTFSWSTTGDLGVKEITLETENGIPNIYHLGSDTTGSRIIYRHNYGTTFDGTPFKAQWSTPWFHMGDSSVRKVLHNTTLFLESEDETLLELIVNYDLERPKTLQPEAFYIEPVLEAARWGEMLWGANIYGALQYPVEDVVLEGSGKWVRCTFKDASDINSSYILRGFNLQFTTGGRI